MFALVAAASGFFSLSQVGSALTRITEERVPQALSWLKLSRLAERVVRAAPALLVVTTESGRVEVSSEITAQAEQLNVLLQQIGIHASEDEASPEARVSSLVGRLNENLASLDELVKKRLGIAARRADLVQRLSQVNSVAQRMVAPSARILDAQIAEWNREGLADGSEAMSTGQAKLARSIVGLIPQQKAGALIEAIQNTLLEIAAVDNAAEINVLMFPLKQSLEKLAEVSQVVPKRVKKRLAKQVASFESLAVGPNSIARVRRDELAVIAQAEDLLAINVRLSGDLTREVDKLIKGANTDIVEARSQASAVQGLNSNIMVGVVVLSLASSVLIVWLYVGRNLIARLTALSDSMLAIADGNLDSPIPGGGNDEIGDMAKALVVFRDTAVEVRKSNLREIEEARRRLSDAIESISEGFSLYDADDRLVVSNSTYRKLLYSGIEDAIVPGAAFATIIREAAERGLVTEATGRVEEWIAERLALHNDPGDPHLQSRSDGRWILISERKTEDGGTVAVYADITELKQREKELSEKSEALEQKSNALEQLSNQLAKYLSPQVYDSIFSGRQEVKVASSRKKLTVFFSDIVGFTETADRMESEELTQLINDYLTEMSQIALDHGATIDKYIGDAILAFFGDPETKGVKEDALACVKMAIAMRKKLLDLADTWRASGIERPLRVRMGIHSGYCTVGNFGSEDRMDYTIIGGAVNTASRLESLAAPNEILISYETFAHIKDEISCEEHGKVEVKGIAYPVATYRVIDTYRNLRRERRHFREEHAKVKLDIDLEAMTTDDRKTAAGLLRRALGLLGEDDNRI